MYIAIFYSVVERVGNDLFAIAIREKIDRTSGNYAD